ncbi:DUF805 domain-containing protein [Shewanella gaetbuli]
MQLNTLWCYQGRDNNLRFMAILLACYSFLALVSLIFPYSLFILFVLVVTSAVTGLSAFRRLRDASKANYWLLAAVIPHIIFGIGCYFIWPLGVIAGLGLFGIAFGVFISFFPAAKKQVYQEGYYGPRLQTKSELGQVRQRYEPQVFGGQPTENVSHESVADTTNNFTADEPYAAVRMDELATTEMVTPPNNATLTANNSEPLTQPWHADHRFEVDKNALDTGSVTELLKSWGNVAKTHQQQLILGLKVVGGVCALGLIIWGVVAVKNGFETDDNLDAAATEMNEPDQSQNRVSAKLPDGFWIVMQDNILIVRWLGEVGDAETLWRLDSAQGDKSCSYLEFNDGSQYRPMRVDLKADESTEARFSPLDNKSIINHIAMRGSFTLCGYDFSLKGSQATLQQHAVFADFLR